MRAECQWHKGNAKRTTLGLGRLGPLIVSLCLLGNTCAQAQRQVTAQDLLWYGYFLTVPLAEKWHFQHEFQERHFVGPLAQHQGLTRGHVHRLLGSKGWETSVGMALFWHNPSDPYAEDPLTVPEWRPHVEMAQRQKSQRWTIDHRYRAEARFYRNTTADKTALAEGFRFTNFRFRYRLQVTMALGAGKLSSRFRVKVSDEIHLNAGRNVVKNVFEQNRLYGAFSVVVTPALALDMGYLRWFQQRTNGDFYQRDIVRVTAFHRVGGRGKT